MKNISWKKSKHMPGTGNSRLQPSYSGGRHQEDFSLKPAWANSSRDPILKNPSQKKIGLVEWLRVKALSSSPRTAKKKKKKLNILIHRKHSCPGTKVQGIYKNAFKISKFNYMVGFKFTT
jgi:hypothetical protein